MQGDGFLKEIFNLVSANGGGVAFSGAIAATAKGKKLYERFKDEAAHLATQMIKAGLITYDRQLAKMRYTHQKLKREGSTTVLKQMQFESRIFKFKRLPSGRIQFEGKKEQHALIKGFSPDLTDNIIMLCGGLCYDCYRELAGATGGELRRKLSLEDIMNQVNGTAQPTRERGKITNSDKILKILSSI